MSDTLSQFADSLAARDCEVARTAPGGLADALDDAVALPAVGVPLPGALALPDDVTVDPTPRQLRDARTGVTPAAFGVAATGTVAVESTARGEEPISLYPQRHVAVVSAADVEPDVEAAFDRLAGPLAADRSSVVLATGPSATGDMGALVRGVHGPGDVHVIVVEEESADG